MMNSSTGCDTNITQGMSTQWAQKFCNQTFAWGPAGFETNMTCLEGWQAKLFQRKNACPLQYHSAYGVQMWTWQIARAKQMGTDICPCPAAASSYHMNIGKACWKYGGMGPDTPERIQQYCSWNCTKKAMAFKNHV
eukprot:gene21322-8100_t